MAPDVLPALRCVQGVVRHQQKAKDPSRGGSRGAWQAKSLALNQTRVSQPANYRATASLTDLRSHKQGLPSAELWRPPITHNPLKS